MFKAHEYCLLLLLVSCAGFPVVLAGILLLNQGALMTDVMRYEKDTAVSEAGGHDMLQYVSHVKNAVWEETAGPVFSPSHWNYHIRTFISAELTTYANNYGAVELEMEQRTLGEDIDAAFVEYAYGTVLVKAHYKRAQDADPVKVTFMIKEGQGYDPAYSNWRYVEVDGNKITANGNSRDPHVYRRCIQCHESVKNRNYLYNNYLHERHHALVVEQE